jgi:hypothetical protein
MHLQYFSFLSYQFSNGRLEEHAGTQWTKSRKEILILRQIIELLTTLFRRLYYFNFSENSFYFMDVRGLKVKS